MQEAAAKRAAAKKLQHAANHAHMDSDEVGGSTKGSANGGCSQDSLDEEGVGGPDSAAPPEEHPTIGDEADPEQSSAGHTHLSDEQPKGRLPFGEGKRHLNGMRIDHDSSKSRMPRERSPCAGDRDPQRNAVGGRGMDQTRDHDIDQAHIKEQNAKGQDEHNRLQAEAERKTREQEERERRKMEVDRKAREQEERERLNAEAERKAREQDERVRLKAEAERKAKEQEERERLKAEVERKAREQEEHEQLKAEAERKAREQEERERLKAEEERRSREQEERERLKAEAEGKAREQEERERLNAEAERKAREQEERERLKAEAERKAREQEERERLKAEAERKAREQEERERAASRHTEADTARSSDLLVKLDPPSTAGGAHKAPSSPGMSSPASPKDAFAERKAALLAEAGSMKRGDEDDLRRKVSLVSRPRCAANLAEQGLMPLEMFHVLVCQVIIQVLAISCCAFKM